MPSPTSKHETPSLLRQLGLFSATALVVSNMIGTGIFTVTGFLAGDLGSAGNIFLIWIIGGICALAGAFCYSELGINFPSSGGEYVYLTRAYGPTWGFMTGWISFFAGFSAPIALASLAFADYLGYFFPALKQANSPVIAGGLRLGGAQAIAASIIAVFTVINCMGVQRTAKIQNILTATKIAVIVGLIVFGLAFGSGSWDHFSQPAARTSTIPVWQQFAVSLFFIYLSYSGWNAATYIAEELRQPERTLPLALTAGTILVGIIFLALNVVFIYATPLEQMKGVVAVGAQAASNLFGSEIAGLFSGLMALSLLATVNAMVTIGPRVYYAMAKNRAFFPAAARINPRYHTPMVAIVCQGVCSMLMTMTPFQDLVFYIGFALNFFAVLSVASIFVFRRRPDWQKLRVVSFLFPLVPAVFLIVGAWITVYGTTLQPRVSLYAVLTIAAGAALYHFYLRRQWHEHDNS